MLMCRGTGLDSYWRTAVCNKLCVFKNIYVDE